ncbi:MAG: hypothetical protein Q8930_19415 [Bacillota bacterium]|nr:hypothetical protein [Bacillota bacterium]
MSDIDVLIKERITAEGREIPDYLKEKKKSVFKWLPEKSRRGFPIWRYSSAFALIVVICSIGYFGYFRLFSGMPKLDNTAADIKSPDYAKQLYDAAYDRDANLDNFAVKEEDKKKAEADGFIVNRAEVMEQEKPSNGSVQSAEKVFENSNADLSAVKKPELQTLQALADSSDVIIQGWVIGIKYVDVKEDSAVGAAGLSVNTEVLVKIAKGFMSDVKSGDILTFIEKGGVTSRYHYLVSYGMMDKFEFTKEELEKAKGEKVLDLEYGDVPLMKPGDEVFLFGQDTGTQYGSTNKIYKPEHDFLGKFIINGEYALRYIPYEWQTVGYQTKIKVTDMQAILEDWRKLEK